MNYGNQFISLDQVVSLFCLTHYNFCSSSSSFHTSSIITSIQGQYCSMDEGDNKAGVPQVTIETVTDALYVF